MFLSRPVLLETPRGEHVGLFVQNSVMMMAPRRYRGTPGNRCDNNAAWLETARARPAVAARRTGSSARGRSTGLVNH